MKMSETMNVRKKVIINADDCGMSQLVNEHIEKAILAGKISSTTVMANMDDLSGAASLYQKYKDEISFGWHLNLSEGKPLMQSQILLDRGFIVETDLGIQFNGRKFKNKFLDKRTTDEIKKEMLAQYESLRDSGIAPTHIDGHHHIHTSIWALPILPSFLKDLGIDKMRRMYNNNAGIRNMIIREGWATYYKIRGMVMPDVLCNYIEFANKDIKKQGDVIELECHPGHPNFTHEEDLLMTLQLSDKYELVTYRQI